MPGVLSGHYEIVAAALVPRSLLWVIPGRGKTKRYFNEYYTFIGYYGPGAVGSIGWTEKKKPYLKLTIMETAALKQQLKKQIVEFLNLMSVKPEDIKDDEPLFGEGLGLDSIDSIELIVLLNREYGINIQDPKEGRKVLVDINTMVDYIEKHRTK